MQKFQPNAASTLGWARNLVGRLTLALAIAAATSAAWGSEHSVLTSLRAVHELSKAEASQSIPVAVEATALYARGYQQLLFVQDGDAALFVTLPTTAAPLPGDRILIKGTTRGSFRPIIAASDIVLLHHGQLPKPTPSTFDDMIRGQVDCRLVKVQALVRATDLITNSTGSGSGRLQLLMDGGHIEANVDGADEDALKRLLDDDVELTGVAAGRFDDKMQQTGVVLYISQMADVKVLRHAGTEFWSLPITPMDQILSGYHLRDLTRRVQVHGTITYYEPGVAVVLQEGSRSLWISTQTRASLRIGDYAVASGFPSVYNRLLSLTDAEIQDTFIQAPVQPTKATWEQLATWSSNQPTGHQNDLVSIEGKVVEEVRVASQDEYVLSTSGGLFSAIYRHPRGPTNIQPMLRIPIGSRARVTGICLVDDTAINPGGEVPFDVLLRSQDDIAVVAGPPLLNVRNLVLLVGVLLVLLMVAGGWGWIKDRKMRLQSATIAYVERRRSNILEDINGTRPLTEILEQITQLTSARLRSAACWCQVADGALIGNPPRDIAAFRVASHPIAGRSGPHLGTLYAAFHPRAKPLNNVEQVLSAAAATSTLAIETRRLYSDLKHRSEFDLLTTIHNRFSLEKYLDLLIEEAGRQAGCFGLIYIDLNEFKQVNDVFGHKVGDMYLQEVAGRMKRQLRSDDMLARLGGDEFAVLVPKVHNRAQVAEILYRLERTFDEPFTFEGYVLTGSASAGIALYPEDGTSRDSLLSAADAAMYVAKQTRRQSRQAHTERLESEA